MRSWPIVLVSVLVSLFPAISKATNGVDVDPQKKVTKADLLDERDQKRLEILRQVQELKKDSKIRPEKIDYLLQLQDEMKRSCEDRMLGRCQNASPDECKGDVTGDCRARQELKCRRAVEKTCQDDDMKYELLVKRAEIEMEKGNEGIPDAIDYLMQATLVNSDRPEANVYLAEIYQKKGYMPEADVYLSRSTEAENKFLGRKAKDHFKDEDKDDAKMKELDPFSLKYDTICFQAQNYMNRGNYYPAIILLARAAYRPDSIFREDPYLISKLRDAILSDPGTFSYWAPELHSMIFRGYSKQLIKECARAVILVMGSNEDRISKARFEPDLVRKLMSLCMREQIMAFLRHSLDVSSQFESKGPDGSRPQYKIRPLVFGFGATGATELDSHSGLDLKGKIDLFELALRASVDNKQDLNRLMAELNKIRDEAKKHCEGLPDKEKGEKLFQFLKEKLLKNYSIVDGIPAENAIKAQQYLCLTGALYYTLIGREDLKLDVAGFLMPGHAYAVMHDGGKDIEVETTSSGDPSAPDYGFDYSSQRSVKQKEAAHAAQEIGARRGGIVFSSAANGEVSPLELVICQYRNVDLNLPSILLFKSYRNEAKAAMDKYFDKRLREELKSIRVRYEKITNPDFEWKGDFTTEDCATTMELVPGDVQILSRRLCSKLAMDNPKFRNDLVATYDRSLKLLETAIELDPFNHDLKNLYQETIVDARDTQLQPLMFEFRTNYNKFKKAVRQQSRDSDTKMTSLSTQPEDMMPASTSSEKGEKSEQGEKAFKTKAQSATEIAEAVFGNTDTVVEEFQKSCERSRKALRKFPNMDSARQQINATANQLQAYLARLQDMNDELLKSQKVTQGAIPVLDLSKGKDLIARLRSEYGMGTNVSQ